LIHFVCNRNYTDPNINLALEEYCYRNTNPEINLFLFYINAPSVIIGKHQNIFSEINYRYAKDRNIDILRRISGGGSVFHDHGNLNFSLITGFSQYELNGLKKLLTIILEVIHTLPIKASLNDKNDIIIEGKKISGSSQITNMRKVINHGTLLFDTHLPTLHEVLNSDTQVIKSSGVHSIKSKVTNLSFHPGIDITLIELMQRIEDAVCSNFGNRADYELSDQDWESIFLLAETKYRSWNWNYGMNPTFIAEHTFTVNASNNEQILLEIKKGLIHNINGNHSEKTSLHKLKNMIGTRYKPLQL
jgi:lipoate-protein ligase A